MPRSRENVRVASFSETEACPAPGQAIVVEGFLAGSPRGTFYAP